MAKRTLERALKTPLNTNLARNVILLLGDGMGVATVTAGRIYAAQRQGKRYGEESSLAFESFPHVGLAKVSFTLHRFSCRSQWWANLKCQLLPKGLVFFGPNLVSNLISSTALGDRTTSASWQWSRKIITIVPISQRQKFSQKFLNPDRDSNQHQNLIFSC